MEAAGIGRWVGSRGVVCVGLGWTGWGVFFCFVVLVSCDGGVTLRWWVVSGCFWICSWRGHSHWGVRVAVVFVGFPPFFLGWWGYWVLFGLGVGPGLPGWPG